MSICAQLEDLYTEDKAEREQAKTAEQTAQLAAHTRERLAKLHKLLPTLDLTEIWNCHYLSYLLHHSEDPADYVRAHEYAAKAVEMGSNVTKWLYAATLDRMLMSQGKRQKYGTQYTMVDGQKVYAPCDGTVSDAERRECGVI